VNECYCRTCKYEKHIKAQQERILFFKRELTLAKEEICNLKAAKGSNIKKCKGDGSDLWLKPKSSKSKSRRFSAGDASSVMLSNRFNVLETLDVGQQPTQPNLTTQMSRPSCCKKSKVLLLGSSHGRGIGPLVKSNLRGEL